MSDLASMNKAELLARAERAQGAIKRLRHGAEAVGTRLVTSALVDAGGFVSGAARGLLGENGKLNLPGTEVDAMLLVGTLGQLLGVSGIFGKASDYMVSFTGGINAAAIDRFTEAMFSKK